MASCCIRLAREADLDALPAIESAAEKRFPPERLVTTTLVPINELRQGAQDGLLWVVDCDQKPVGFCLTEQFDRDLHVVEIDVHPDYGRQGKGRALMQTAIDAARARACRRLTLTTFADMPWNRPFYESLGFAVIAPSKKEVRLTAQIAKEKARGAVQRVAMVLML